MEIKANSFSLRGESGVVKIVSDSPFVPGDPGIYAEQAECDITIESDGFRVSKAITLGMPAIGSFLVELRELVAARTGKATFRGSIGGLSLLFMFEGDEPWVECEMNDKAEGKDNSVRIRYPIEPAYFEDLVGAFALESRIG